MSTACLLLARWNSLRDYSLAELNPEFSAPSMFFFVTLWDGLCGERSLTQSAQSTGFDGERVLKSVSHPRKTGLARGP